MVQIEADLLASILPKGAASNRRTLIGLSAPQASGKTWATQHIPSITALSTDDFYCEAGDGDPLLQFRGNPGTHDLALLEGVLRDLQRSSSVRVPVFDKNVNGGRGARVGFREVQPRDVVVLEGWSLGFMPAESPPPRLVRINRRLRDYLPVYGLLDALIVAVDSPAAVKEQRLAAGGLPSGSEELFVDNCLCVYEAYAPVMERQFSLSFPHIPVIRYPTLP